MPYKTVILTQIGYTVRMWLFSVAKTDKSKKI